ncbi:MAG: Phenylalanine--tRNA ligase beta subunit [Phycisphaerae bacterium]|nr:Phenylalanine--tRNA ligase beta subunit [Phycisphaerae bacterium]
MKISYDWLKTYAPTDLPADALAEKLLLAGFPVEEMFAAAGGDTLMDVEVTSNRPDLLCHLGMAREVSALTGATFTPPKVTPAGDAPDTAGRTSVTMEAPAACPLYTARIIEGVKVGPSPDWLVRRIEAIGLRPVNNVVDITNFVLFEYSQPLHAFDMDKLAEGRIVVRMARAGETITSIDGHERKVDPSMLVIADARRPVAVAGVMGGRDTEVSSATTTILLESAWFDPMSIRSTARKLALFSDSSYRFERGVDPAGVREASNRAVDLIAQLCGGRPLPGFAAGGKLDPQTPEIAMRLDRLAMLLGIDVPADRAMTILASLQLSPKLDDRVVRCTAPSFRQDLRREVDLIEEVARVQGYDAIPVGGRVEVDVRPPNPRRQAVRRVAATLCSLGLHETVSFTFVPGDLAELFARGPAGHLAVTHPSRKQENALRRSLLPSLLRARRHNETVQVRRADLFEIAHVFNPPAPDSVLPDEPLRLGLCTDGGFRFAGGLIEEVVRGLDRNAAMTIEPADRPGLEAGRAGAVLLNGVAIGLIGVVSADVRGMFDLGVEVTVAEIDVQPLIELASHPRRFTALARFPAIERDLSMLVDQAAAWAEVVRTIRDSAPCQLEAVDFVEEFRGKQVPAGKKSLTLTLRYRRADGTLTHEEVDGYIAPTVAALADRLGAQLRDK